MLTRALIVLLVVLNLGVAAWWIWRPEPAARAVDDDLPTGIARLRLLQEADAGTGAARPVDATRGAAAQNDASTPGSIRDSALDSAPDATPASTATQTPSPTPSDPPPTPETAAQAPATAEQAAQPAAQPAAASATAATPRCYRIGPYPDELARTAALPAIRPYASTMRSREARAAAGRGWRVIVPPATNADTATAMAERIRAAGFSDYFVVRDGADANAIALGRFSSEDRARQHAAALAAAGFPARAEALGDARPQYWVDIVAVADAELAAIRRAAGGPDVRPGECPAPR